MENKIKSLPAHLEEQHTACCITCLWRRVAKHLTSTEEADNAYSAKNEVIHHSRATSSTFLSQISYNSSVTNAKGGGGSLWAFCVVWVLRAPSHHFACPEEKNCTFKHFQNATFSSSDEPYVWSSRINRATLRGRFCLTHVLILPERSHSWGTALLHTQMLSRRAVCHALQQVISPPHLIFPCLKRVLKTHP